MTIDHPALAVGRRVGGQSPDYLAPDRITPQGGYTVNSRPRVIDKSKLSIEGQSIKEIYAGIENKQGVLLL